MGQYDGKRVVITGGTSGIGLATAKLLADGGARVLVTGRSQAGVDAARAELGKAVTVLASDATSLADIDALAGRARTELGGVDLLFANAGFAKFLPFENMTEAVYDEMLSLNAKGPYFAAQKLAPLMPSGSAVVFTTTIANEKGMPMITAYAAAKAALRAFTRSLASELLPRGIRVNAVSPGPIATPILQKTFPTKEVAAQFEAQMRDGNPMKRFGRPEEVAKAVAFLAFEATFTTGAELPVDGGFSQV
jgi:NAD(P)-dependent dehydrogenase (short-subunit alcohol dehydrogenase family)